MTENINLLAKKNAHNVQQERVLKLCKQVSVVFLLITAGSSLLFFILTLNPSLSSIKEQENNMLTNLSFTQGKVAKYLLIKNRLTMIGNIVKTRYPIDVIISTVQQQVPSDVSIDTMSIENKTLVMTLSSPSLVSLNIFLTNITSLGQNKSIIKKMVLESMSANAGLTSYTLSLKANLL
jgi:hypothetical protein